MSLHFVIEKDMICLNQVFCIVELYADKGDEHDIATSIQSVVEVACRTWFEY